MDAKLDNAERNNPNQFGNKDAVKPNLNEAPAWSVLSVVYLTFIFFGGFCGFLCMVFVVLRMSAFAAALHLFSLGLGAAASGGLGSQMVIGFPVERHMKQQIDKQRAEQAARNAQFGVQAQPPADDGTDFWIEVKYTGWLWLSFALTLFCLPVFLLEFVILIADAVRKHMRQSADSG